MKPTREDQRAYIRRIRMRWEKVENREAFPFRLPVLRGLEELPLNPRMTLFVGENGSGKSTFLEAIAGAAGMNLEGGGSNHSFATTRERSPLADALLLVRGTRRPTNDFFLRAESFFNVSSYYEQIVRDYEINMKKVCHEPMKDLHYMSHGEGFLKLVCERFSETGLYILDEPEAALSPTNLLVLMRRIHFLSISGAQFIIATHSPILMAQPGATLYHLSSDGPVKTSFRATSHYLITKRFLDDPDSMIEQLIRED